MRRYGPGMLVHDGPIIQRADGGWVYYDDVRAMIENAQKVARLLELGDRRLLASDGPCSGQNAAVALSPEESAKLYQACKKIAAEAADGEEE